MTEPNVTSSTKKRGLAIFVLTIVVFGIIALPLISMFSCKTECESAITTLSVANTNQNDTVLVYLTINASEGYVSDVNGIFGITSDNKTQGSFYLNPNDTLTYSCPKDKAISGNISFWSPPLNCPYVGTTLYEFALNNEKIAVNSQETVDISCVAGVSSFGSISMSGGGDWTDNFNKAPITLIENDSLYKNTGISGVFPFGCTNCVNQEGAPDCEGRPAYATPNVNNICNVQRNAKNSGGTVVISYISK
jgi:hypothetical protein